MTDILAVDDDVGLTQLLRAILEGEGYAVRTAADGHEALAQINRAPPALILLDLMMPNMDGSAFLRHRLEHPSLLQIPVVVLSAKHDAAAAVAGLAVDHRLAKPYNLVELLDVVARYVPPPVITA